MSPESREFWHVVAEGWAPGEALYSFDELECLGLAPVWKWDGEPIDTDVVCLFDSESEATAMQAEYGGRLLQVCLPEWFVAERATRVGEGYLAVRQQIPGEYVRVVESQP